MDKKLEKLAEDQINLQKAFYKTLEQQIRELWASRGFEVVEETVRALKNGKFKWTIIAREKKCQNK